MSNSAMRLLIEALLEGDQARSVAEATKLRKAGVGIEQIVVDGIGKAMEQLDGKCTIDQFNLLEIMLVGRAVMGVIKELFPKVNRDADSGHGDRLQPGRRRARLGKKYPENGSDRKRLQGHRLRKGLPSG